MGGAALMTTDAERFTQNEGRDEGRLMAKGPSYIRMTEKEGGKSRPSIAVQGLNYESV